MCLYASRSDPTRLKGCPPCQSDFIWGLYFSWDQLTYVYEANLCTLPGGGLWGPRWGKTWGQHDKQTGTSFLPVTNRHMSNYIMTMPQNPQQMRHGQPAALANISRQHVVYMHWSWLKLTSSSLPKLGKF